MTSAARTRKSRLLLVGDGHAARLADNLGEQAVFARDPLCAIGEMTAAPAHTPIALVVLSESSVQGVSQHPAQELRRLDPSVRIGLVRDAHEADARASGDALAEEEFDVVFHDWPSAEELSRVLQGEEVGGRFASTPATEDEPRGATPNAPQRRASAAPPTLGDVDLVEAIMSGSDVRDLALQLIEQHTGWSDVQHQPETQVEDSPGRARREHATAIRYGGQEFGALQSRQAPTKELQRWADWLAKWLALEGEHRTYREQSYRDDLTGAWNRRYFMEFLTQTITVAAKRRRPVSVMVFDLDDFKRYNDEYGHAAGDDILRETVRLLNSVIRKSDRVCRIGGDEFAVIFADIDGPREKGSTPPETVEQLAQRFQDQVCKMNFPKLGIEAPGTLSVSAGLATFPWDGWEPERILQHADELALQSKRKGKNVLTLGQGAQKVCKPESTTEEQSTQRKGPLTFVPVDEQ